MIDERFECEILRASRTRLLHLIETSNYELLFKIPAGFNNNIIWQIGHCINSQQRHMYMRSGLPMYIAKEFMESFKIGSSPASWKITPDVNEVKHLLIDTVNHLEADLESRLFVNYELFELPMGFQVKNHIQALQAANYHEAEHSGKIFTYLKLPWHVFLAYSGLLDFASSAAKSPASRTAKGFPYTEIHLYLVRTDYNAAWPKSAFWHRSVGL